MKNKIFVFLFFILFLFPLLSASTDWLMFRHDPQHTGYTDCEMPDELEVLWKYKTGDYVDSSPAVVNGKLCFGSRDGYLYCFGARSVPPPSQQSNSLLYLGFFVPVIICVLVIYQITRKKSEKEVIEEPTKKKPEEKPKLPKEESSPKLQKLLQERDEWRAKLEYLKNNKDELIKEGAMSEEYYQQRSEEIINKLVDIEDKIIQEKIKGGKKK